MQRLLDLAVFGFYLFPSLRVGVLYCPIIATVKDIFIVHERHDHAARDTASPA
jgi:hypothetical protein